jgi:hypothetical protein
MASAGSKGFDHEPVRQLLEAWLRDACQMSPNEAQEHRYVCHGIPAQPDPAHPDRFAVCGDSPCKVEAVSLALYEIEYRTNTRQLNRVEMVLDLEKLAGLMRTGYQRVVAIQQHSEPEIALNAARAAVVSRTILQPDAATRWGERPMRCIEQFVQVFQSIEALARETRAELVSQGINVPTGARGRPRLVLLDAITWHLRRGGFTIAEIAELVPDGIPVGDEPIRVRPRTKNDDRRSVVPFEDWSGRDEPGQS